VRKVPLFNLSRRTNALGEHLEIPVSWEAAWGVCTHWLGRGFQGCPKPQWLVYAADEMMDSRDAQGNSHFHMWIEDYLKTTDDPAHSALLANFSKENWQWAMLKDTSFPANTARRIRAAPSRKPSCSRLRPASTSLRTAYGRLREGPPPVPRDPDRTAGRTRDLEVENMYYWLTYPDPWGKVVSWTSGTISSTWSTRQTATTRPPAGRSVHWEKYGLKEIADEMEKVNMLPPEGGTPGCCPQGDPFDR
jgi:hypothetical protein